MAIDQAMEDDDAVYIMGEEVSASEPPGCCWHFCLCEVELTL